MTDQDKHKMELLPCPFCGKQPRIEVDTSCRPYQSIAGDWYNSLPSASVRCFNTKEHGVVDCHHSNKDVEEAKRVAIKRWNTRALSPPPPSAEVAAALAAIERAKQDSITQGSYGFCDSEIADEVFGHLATIEAALRAQQSVPQEVVGLLKTAYPMFTKRAPEVFCRETGQRIMAIREGDLNKALALLTKNKE